MFLPSPELTEFEAVDHSSFPAKTRGVKKLDWHSDLAVNGQVDLRFHRFVFVDQAAEDIDPANARHLG